MTFPVDHQTGIKMVGTQFGDLDKLVRCSKHNAFFINLSPQRSEEIDAYCKKSNKTNGIHFCTLISAWDRQTL